VMLAVEVVSPGTRRRDRLEKPGHYADAGIPPYWRVQKNPVHVYAHQLAEGRDELAGESAEGLYRAKPVGIRLRVRDLTPCTRPG
ncbi:Uma2 family endonuclease, partial [Micromonospora arborensis]